MSTPRPLRSCIAELLLDPEDVLLARSILGTDTSDGIAACVESHCRAHLGREVTGCLAFTQSVGAVFALMLDDGSPVVLKAHGRNSSRLGSRATPDALAAVYGVQAALAAQGIPCARVIHAPIPWESGMVAAMEYLVTGEHGDAHEPRVRHAMAVSLAELIRSATELADVHSLPISAPPEEHLFPEPHNVLFDFTTPGGEWIDDRARRARRALESAPEQVVVAHTDYSAANLRILGDRVSAIYDMDSVARVDEMRCLAGAAVHFTYNPHLGAWTWPSREEAIAFAEEYAHERGAPLSRDERERLGAWAIYALAYTARCEHALDPKGEKLEGSMRDALRRAPDAGYLG